MGPADDLWVDGARVAVLVEGQSDRAAVHASAALTGQDLSAEAVVVLAMGGATNIGHFVRRLRPLGTRLAGLCDEAEVRFFVQALGTEDLARQGFFVCRRDLEDELIRALGTDRVLDLLAEHRDRSPYETFCRQPAQRDRTEHDRLRRFLGTHSGRKIAYGSRLVEALGPDEIPEPLTALLGAISLS